jgi:HEAT repeat protein
VPLFLIVVFVLWLVIGMTVAGGIAANLASKNAPLARNSPSPNLSSARPAPPVTVDPNTTKLDSLQRQVDAMNNESLNRTTREQAQSRITTLRDQLNNLQEAKGNTDQWRNVSAALDSLAEKVASLPSEKPDETIYRPMSAASTWSAAPGAPDQEVSVAAINLVPPADSKLDLKSTETSNDGLTWILKNRWSKMSVKVIDAPDTRQQRPWIVPSWVAQRASQSQKLLIIDSDQTNHQVGTIGGMTFVRVESGQGSQQKVTYAGLVGGKWVVATLQPGSETDTLVAMESAVKTIRKRDPGEARSDPFDPQRLVPRLADDPQQAAALLKRSGGDLEELLLPAVESKDARLSAEAAKLLAGVATEKSLPALRKLMSSSDREVAAAARASLQRLRPQEFDSIAMAVLDLSSDNTFKKRDAMKSLAAATPDAKRPEVTRAIEAVVLDSAFFANEESITALGKWANSETVVKLLPWLDEKAGFHERRVAMQVLGATKDKRAVLPIVRWIIKEPENVVKALSAMGPVAEDEVVKLLRERDNTVRKNAARILQEIGTQKSVAALQRASTDPRDATAAQAAQIALEMVKERVKQSKPATSPAQ